MRRTSRPWLIGITVEGLNIGRFVRRVGEADIRLTQLNRRSAKRITALVCEADLPKLHQIAQDGGWQLQTGERKGLGFTAEWVRKRWILVMVAMIGGIALFLCSQTMWSVKVVDGGTYQADIKNTLEDMGIVPPMLRGQVDIGQVRQELEWRYPRIAWFECGWRGTSLVVHPVEGVLPRKETTTTDWNDIVASRDAIVHRIVTKAGTPVVKPGDFVQKGELLIKGEERTSNGEVKLVNAEGSVTGRAWLGATVEKSLYTRETEYTGNEQTVWTVRTPWFDLWQMEPCTFDTYDVAVSEQAIGGIFIPMKLYTETRLEAVITSVKEDIGKVQAEAEKAATRKLHEKLAPEESLIDIWGNCSMIDDEKVQAQAIGEMLVEIGVAQVSSGMAAPADEDSE